MAKEHEVQPAAEVPQPTPAATENTGPDAIKHEQEVADRLNKQAELKTKGAYTGHDATYEELPKPQNDPDFGTRYPTGAQVHQRVIDNAPEVAEQADRARRSDGGHPDGQPVITRQPGEADGTAATPAGQQAASSESSKRQQH